MPAIAWDLSLEYLVGTTFVWRGMRHSLQGPVCAVSFYNHEVIKLSACHGNVVFFPLFLDWGLLITVQYGTCKVKRGTETR